VLKGSDKWFPQIDAIHCDVADSALPKALTNFLEQFDDIFVAQARTFVHPIHQFLPARCQRIRLHSHLLSPYAINIALSLLMLGNGAARQSELRFCYLPDQNLS
jgi:hypothetical protein